MINRNFINILLNILYFSLLQSYLILYKIGRINTSFSLRFQLFIDKKRGIVDCNQQNSRNRVNSLQIPMNKNYFPTNLRQVGCDVLTILPVFFRRPFWVLISYIWISLLSLQATRRYFPFGDITKFRGCKPVG